MLNQQMVQGKMMTTTQQALSKSVHFTLGSSILPTKTPDPASQSVIVKPNAEISQVVSVDCVTHGRPLKGFCLDPEYRKRRKLCVNCLWENPCVVKMQQPEFVKTLIDKVQIAGPNFFEHLNKILKKDHLQQEIDEMFLKIKQEIDSYLNDIYSQYMWWSKHGMGSQLMMKEHIISDILFDENIIDELQNLVLNGRAMEASDETINICAELINSDAQTLATLPDHLARALEQCETIIRSTLKELEAAFQGFRNTAFEFKNIPSDATVTALRIPGTQASFGQFGMNFSKLPDANFIGSSSQLPKNQSELSTPQIHATSTSYHQRFSSNLAANLNPKLFADARDLHQSQIWAICKVSPSIVASGDWQGNIKLIGLTPDGQYQFIQAFNHGKNVYALTMAEGRDNMLVSAGQNEKDEWTLKIWEIEKGRLVREMKGHTNYIFQVVMPNPNQIVSCSYDETVRVWDFDNGANITVFKEFKTSFNDLCVWSQHEIITCSDDKAIRMFNINTGQLKMQIFDQYFVNGIARVSSKEIAVGNFKGEILIINMVDQKIVRRMGSHKNFVWRVKQLDGDLLASASFDKTVKIWEWKSGSLVASLEGHTEIVRSLELLEESYLLISGSDDRSLKIWRLI